MLASTEVGRDDVRVCCGRAKDCGGGHHYPPELPAAGALWGARRTMTSGCRQELLSLHLPLDWKWLQEPCEPSGRPPVHGALDDVRCEQSEAENPAGIGEADTFRFRQLSDRSEPALVQHPLPSPRPGQCLDQRSIGLRLPRRRKLASVRARRYASGRCDVGTAKARGDAHGAAVQLSGQNQLMRKVPRMATMRDSGRPSRQ